MKYEPQHYEWTHVLRARVQVNQGLVSYLEEQKLYGDTKMARGRINDVWITVWRPDELIPGIECDIILEKRNDGRKRIVFHPGENEGIEMSLQTFVNQTLKWVEACGDESVKILDTIFLEKNED